MPSPVRLGVVGTGAISRLHAAAVAAHPEAAAITAVTDVDGAAAAAYADHVGPGVKVFDDLETLIASGVVDAVVVATPHHLHATQAMQLVAAGVPALVEKPLVTDLDDLRALRDAVERRGSLLVAGHMQRFDPVNVLARHWIDADPSRFGALQSFAMRSWQDITAYTGRLGPGHWLLDGARAGGGVVVSLAVHQLDLLRYLGGTDYATVTAVGTFGPPFHGGAEAGAAVLLTTRNGASGTLHSTYAAPRGFQSESVSLFGEHGGFTRDFRPHGLYHGPLLYCAAHEEEVVDLSAVTDPRQLGLSVELGGDQFSEQLLHFVRAVRDTTRPENTVARNFNTIACIAAVNTALRHPGTTVAVARE